MTWAELDTIGQRQLALVTRCQVLARMTEDQLEHLVQTRKLDPMRPRVYRAAGSPRSWEQDVLAVCLATGAVASHRTAARLWGIAYVPAERVEVTAAGDRRVRLPGIRPHRSTFLPASHLTSLGPIPITTGERTVIDLSAVLGTATLDRAINDALRRGVATAEGLAQCLDDLAVRGRRRIAVLRPLLAAHSDDGDGSETVLEARIFRWIVSAGLPRPVQQLWVVAGGKRFRLDMAFPAERVDVEPDGWEAHRTRRSFDHDRERRNLLELAGWQVLQFTSRTPRRVVIETVERALEIGRQRLSVAPPVSGRSSDRKSG